MAKTMNDDAALLALLAQIHFDVSFATRVVRGRSDRLRRLSIAAAARKSPGPGEADEMQARRMNPGLKIVPQ